MSSEFIVYEANNPIDETTNRRQEKRLKAANDWGSNIHDVAQFSHALPSVSYRYSRAVNPSCQDVPASHHARKECTPPHDHHPCVSYRSCLVLHSFAGSTDQYPHAKPARTQQNVQIVHSSRAQSDSAVTCAGLTSWSWGTWPWAGSALIKNASSAKRRRRWLTIYSLPPPPALNYVKQITTQFHQYRSFE